MKRMIWSRFFRRWFTSRPAAGRRSSSKRLPRTSARPRLEALEDRTLLTTYNYLVNLATDTGGPNGTGQSTSTPAGYTASGDLRYCINQADLNNASGDNNVITFDNSVFPSTSNTTIALSHGELEIAANMSISNANGPGTIAVSGTADGGSHASRIFNISSSTLLGGGVAVVKIAGLTIENGNANVAYTTIDGNQGGDIFNGGNLTLTNDIVENGHSRGSVGGADGKGGAIFNAEGQGSTVLTLDNTLVENSRALGNNGANFGGTTAGAGQRGQSGGSAGSAYGGGVYNDTDATLILENGSQLLNNKALGGTGGNGQNGGNGPSPGGNGGAGGSGGTGGNAYGGGIYNAGALELKGTGALSITLEDDLAQGGMGGYGGRGGNGANGKVGGTGGGGGTAATGGAAYGGAVYNTGSASSTPGGLPSFTLSNVNFLGDQAVGGAGNHGGDGGTGGSGSSLLGGHGGAGGGGSVGGSAQGGGIYSVWGSLTVPNSTFGVGANGVGDQAVGGTGGYGGNGGAGGKSAKQPYGGTTLGVFGGKGGVGEFGGSAAGGAVANLSGGATFISTSFTSSLAQGGSGGAGGNGGTGGIAGKVYKTKIGNTSFVVRAGTGGLGGSGAGAGFGGAAKGGAIYNTAGTLSITTSSPNGINSVFAGNQAIAGDGAGGGAGGAGGVGGTGAATGSGGHGGFGGHGGAGNVGGNAQGGGFYNSAGTVTISATTFEANKGVGNQAISGDGGAGGDGGNGGQGGNNPNTSTGNQVGGPGGNANNAGNADVAGLAAGGAGYNSGGDTFLTNDQFLSSMVQTGAGGAGGNTSAAVAARAAGTGGNGGNGNARNGIGGAGGNATSGATSGPGFGGAIAVVASNLTVTDSTFSNNAVQGGAGGAGGTGGGVGSYGNSGGNPSNTYIRTINAGITAGAGGAGGVGSPVNGGALSTGGSSSSKGSTKNVTISGSTFSNNAITSGAGGAGGRAGLFSDDGRRNGINGVGGNGGLAQGGAVFLSTTNASQTATFALDSNGSGNTIVGSSATGGAGGAGTINLLQSTTIFYHDSNGYGSQGGDGGSVEGVGLANVNYNLNINGGNSFNSGVGQGGKGGKGGGSTSAEPSSWQGGNGGSGGNVQGGGIYFSNTQGTLTLQVSDASASNNRLTGGTGGAGGNAGGSGSYSIAGGNGGNAGYAQGGGIYILAGASSVNTTSLSGLTLDDNVVNGGTGGNGGAGGKFDTVTWGVVIPNPANGNSAGGNGGLAQGGGIFNTNTSSKSGSSLNLSDSTFASNQAKGGFGGIGGSGTTPNGGAGGDGGLGANADGAGLYNGNNTPLNVVNTTFGGPSADPKNVNEFANVLTGGNGGRGGDAGLPPSSPFPYQNGGDGGSGGTIDGGNVYVLSNTANFINDTIVYGLATSPGTAGLGGSGRGSGGSNGNNGNPGTGEGGGYFAAGGTNSVGNTIIALNNAVTNQDVAGDFTDLGWNIIGLLGTANGFTQASDKIGGSVSATTLNFGPLRNNGGPTATDALLGAESGIAASIAIDAGGNTLVTDSTKPWHNLFGATASNPYGYDQRGTGFLRNSGSAVDVGAFEYQPPVITSLSPNSDVEQDSVGILPLTISGTGFTPGSIVTFNGTQLANPGIEVNGGVLEIVVNVPSSLTQPLDEGTVVITVTSPDGSGVSGQMLSPPATAPFTITEGTSITLKGPGDQINNEGDIVNLSGTITVPAVTSSDPDTYFTASGLPPGLSINANTGLITGTIDAYDANNSPYSVTINGHDDSLSGPVQGTWTFTWTVNDTTAPVLSGPTSPPSYNEGTVLSALNNNTIQISSTDPDTTYTANFGGLTGLGINSATGVISGTIGAYAAGTYTVKVTGTDPDNTTNPTGTFTFQLIVNDTTAPVLSGPTSPQSYSEGAVLSALNNNTIQISSTDPDTTYTANFGGLTGLSINASGVISGTIGAYAAGTYTVKVTGTDPDNTTNPTGTFTFQLIVNDTTAPVLSGPSSPQNYNEGAVLSAANNNTIQISSADPDTTYTANFGGLAGLSINSATGVISGTIGAYAAGTYNVTVTGTDPDNTTHPTGTFTFQLVVNDTTAPAFVQYPTTTLTDNEGDTRSTGNGNAVQITATDADTYTDLYNGQHTLPLGLTIDNNGLITGTIIPGADGTHTVYITAIDTDNTTNPSATISFSWTVADNLPPPLTGPSSPLTYNEGTVLSAANNNTIQIGNTDPDTTYTADFGGLAGLSINSSGVISGTIGAYAAGTYNITVNGTDPDNTTGNNSTSISFQLIVKDTTAPVLSGPSSPPSYNEGTVLSAANNNTIQISSTDPDTTYTADFGGLTGLSINASGVISGTIGAYAAGTYTVKVTGTDPDNTTNPTGTFTFQLIVNDTTAPVLSGPTSPQSYSEGAVLSALNNNSIQISSTDPDTTYTANFGGLTGLSINASGVISGTIGAYAAGTYTVKVTGTDPDNTTNSTGTFTFQLIVNDITAPVLSGPTSPPSYNEGTVLSAANNNTIQISSTDPDTTYTANFGGLTGLSINSATGVISGAIGNYAAGTYNVTVTGTDPDNATNPTGTFTFQLIVNDITAPVLSGPSSPPSYNEGTVLSAGNNNTIQISSTDPDTTYAANFGGLAGLSINSSGVISGTIGAYAAGTYTVKVTGTDPDNTTNPTGTFTFQLIVNDTTAPTLTSPGDQTSNEGASIDLKLTSTDVDKFSITGLPGGLTYNSSTGEITGAIGAYAASSTPYKVTVTAIDSDNTTSTNSATVSFNWTVSDTSAPTVNNPGPQTSSENQTITPLQLTATDADSFTIKGLPTGLTYNSSTGLISGTIAPYAVTNGQASQDFTVTVTATDTDNSTSTNTSSPITFTWTVNDTTAPVFSNPPGNQTNNEGDTVSISAQAQDADSYSASNLPPGLTINATSGLISGTIGAYASGSYNVQVTATDNGNSSDTTFNWTVNDTSPPTLTAPKDQTNNEGDKVSLPIPAVDAESFTATGLPLGLSINANTGVISGTIDPHGAGNYSVTVTGTDNGHSSSVSFSWVVADTTPPTLTNPGNQTNISGNNINLGVGAQDADPGSFTATGLPPGLGINPTTGTITGTIFAAAGTYNPTITAADGGHTNSISFAWTVNQTPTSVVVTNVQNSYAGLVQVETVTVQVTNGAGLPVNEGFVTLNLNGETLVGYVHNGYATVTFLTPMFELELLILLNDFFPHGLDAVFSDPAGVFGSAGASTSVPGMLLDFLLYLQTAQLQSSLAQS
jgi:hypothetical protein